MDGEMPHAALEFSHSNKPSRHLDRDFKIPPMKHVQIALFHQNSRQPYFLNYFCPLIPITVTIKITTEIYIITEKIEMENKFDKAFKNLEFVKKRLLPNFGLP